jgi:hypothetical protein
MSTNAGATQVADAKVSRLQDALRGLGHDPGPSDGLFGEKTFLALARLFISETVMLEGFILSVSSKDYGGSLPPRTRLRRVLVEHCGAAPVDAELDEMFAIVLSKMSDTDRQDLLDGITPLLEAIVVRKNREPTGILKGLLKLKGWQVPMSIEEEEEEEYGGSDIVGPVRAKHKYNITHPSKHGGKLV